MEAAEVRKEGAKQESEGLVTLDELSRIAKVPKSWLYERSRRDAIPGQRRLGRHIRVALDEFRAGVRAGALA